MTTVVLGVLFALSLGLLACAVVLKVRNDAVYAWLGGFGSRRK